MNREIKYIVIHSTRTHKEVAVQDLRHEWNTQNKKPRFHCVIDTNGHAHRFMGANHCTAPFLIKNNEECYHIAYLGGLHNVPEVYRAAGVPNDGFEPEDTRTPLQMHILFEKIEELRRIYPDAKVVGADELIHESTGRTIGSPAFNVSQWLKFHAAHREDWIEKDIELLDEQQREEKELWYPWEK